MKRSKKLCLIMNNWTKRAKAIRIEDPMNVGWGNNKEE